MAPLGDGIPVTAAGYGGVYLHNEPTLADMVAIGERSPPLGALTVRHNQQSTIDIRPTSFKWKPREGANAAWESEFRDILSANGLTYVVDGDPPTRDAVRGTFISTSDNRLIDCCYNAVLVTWWADNTRLYFLLQRSIDLAGSFNALDLEHVTTNFVDGLGDLRDGASMLKWLRSLYTVGTSSFSDQAELYKAVTGAKVPPNATCIQIGLILEEMLSKWLKIKGNSIRTRFS